MNMGKKSLFKRPPKSPLQRWREARGLSRQELAAIADVPWEKLNLLGDVAGIEAGLRLEDGSPLFFKVPKEVWAAQAEWFKKYGIRR